MKYTLHDRDRVPGTVCQDFPFNVRLIYGLVYDFNLFFNLTAICDCVGDSLFFFDGHGFAGQIEFTFLIFYPVPYLVSRASVHGSCLLDIKTLVCKIIYGRIILTGCRIIILKTGAVFPIFLINGFHGSAVIKVMGGKPVQDFRGCLGIGIPGQIQVNPGGIILDRLIL